MPCHPLSLHNLTLCDVFKCPGSPMNSREALLQVSLSHWPCQRAPSPTAEPPSAPKTQKETHTHTPKTHTGNSFWQPGDAASRCSDAVSTAEMSTTSDSKFIKRTHLHFNLKCQANMHSFALKGIPIIEQTDRPGISFVLLISHWTKMSIMPSGNFKESQVVFGPLSLLIFVYMSDKTPPPPDLYILFI